MDSLSGCTICTHFADLPDPRIERAKRHDLLAIVTIALCVVICGTDSWVEVERFGRAKERWLATLVSLPNGIPVKGMLEMLQRQGVIEDFHIVAELLRQCAR